MTIFGLPRGLASNKDRPLATARWATAEDVARFAVLNERNDDGALQIGFFPHPEFMETLEKARIQAADAWIAVAASAQPAKAKARLQQQIEERFEKLYVAACRPVTLADDRHCLTAAGSRSGKGSSSLLRNLMLFTGSAVVLDPKGESAIITAERRGPGNAEWCEGMGQRVLVFDPYGETKGVLPDDMRASFNPLDLLDPESDTFIEDVNAFADALIVPAEGDQNKHFDEMARRFIAAVICYAFCFYYIDEDRRPITPDLPRIRNLLMRGDKDAALIERELQIEAGADAGRLPDLDPVKAMLRTMLTQPEFANRAMANDAGALLNTGDREFGGIMTTVARATAFADSKMMQKVLRPSNFRPEQLKTSKDGMTVYICLPPRYWSTAAPWMRLLLTCFLNSLQQDLAPPTNGKPILFLMDEFSALGRMQIIEDALAYAATYSILLWPVVQGYHQLEKLYGKAASGFVGNAALVEFFGNGEQETAKLCSDMLGEVEISRTTANSNYAETGGSSTPSNQEQLKAFKPAGVLRTALGLAALAADSRQFQDGHSYTQSSNEGLHVAPLLRTDEVKAMAARQERSKIAIPNGGLPMFLHRIDYFRDPRLAGRFRPLPYHESGTRSRQKPLDLVAFDEIDAAVSRANLAYAELIALIDSIPTT